MALAPIVLFTYNRPQHTERTLEALKACDLASESDLIIYSDGVKNEKGGEKVLQTRKIIHATTGFKSIEIIESDKNKGLARSVIEGVTSVIDSYSKVIVLEDDLVVSPNFLAYMNHYLDVYENEEKVISIHGYVYPIEAQSKAPFFIQGADCWGWATWKRGWDLFEEDADKLYEAISADKELSRRFDFGGSYPYLKMLKDQLDGKIDSWAIRWYASAFLKDKLTLYPSTSLVRNIGMDGSGTHVGKTSKFNFTDVNASSVFPRPDKLLQDESMFMEFNRFFKSISPSILKRLLNKLKI
jgi:hypothetical protein